MTAALKFCDLTLGYDRHPAVHHLNGTVDAGALVAVVGPNGAGKSTLFKGIVGAIKPLAGRIELGGVRAQDIAYLPQAAEIDRSFPINLYDMVSMGLWRRTGVFGGMLAATFLAIFFVPLFFVLIQKVSHRLTGGKRQQPVVLPAPAQAEEEEYQHA